MTSTIDKIRAEVDRLVEEARNNPGLRWDVPEYVLGVQAILPFLDTLQEQEPQGLDVTNFCKPIKPGIAKCIADHWWDMMDDEDKQGLDEAAERYRRDSCNAAMMPNIDGPMPEYGGSVKDAFKAGAEWMADKMK